MLIIFKKWFYKQQIAHWEANILSVEVALEYCNIPDGDEVNRLIQTHKEYSTIINALKLLIVKY